MKNSSGNGSRVELALERFLDEEKFKALFIRMNQIGFRHTGESAFEGQRFDGVE